MIELRTQSLRSILALCARPSRFMVDPCISTIICPNDVKYFYQFVKTDFDLHLNLNYRSKILQFLVSNGIERVAYFSDNRTTFKQIFSCHLGFWVLNWIINFRDRWMSIFEFSTYKHISEWNLVTIYCFERNNQFHLNFYQPSWISSYTQKTYLW